MQIEWKYEDNVAAVPYSTLPNGQVFIVYTSAGEVYMKLDDHYLFNLSTNELLGVNDLGPFYCVKLDATITVSKAKEQE